MLNKSLKNDVGKHILIGIEATRPSSVVEVDKSTFRSYIYIENVTNECLISGCTARAEPRA